MRGLYTIESTVQIATDYIVPTFFVISGYLFYQNFSLSKLPQKLKSRLSSLVVPFMVWNLIGFLYLWLLSRLPVVGNIVKCDANIPLAAFIRNILCSKYNGPTWFLGYLILFTFLPPFYM